MAFLEKNIAPEMHLETDGSNHQFLALSGDWTVSTIGDAETEIANLNLSKQGLTCIDVSKIEHLDTS
ncbi:MAG: ABC transporter permease, partial [Pseudomonadota bacterium]